MRAAMGERWKQEQIAAEILNRHVQNLPLSYGEIQREDLRLLRAATRHFGNWQRAIEAAGLDYDTIRRYRAWTRERILDEIRKYHADGQDLSWRHVASTLNPGLAAAAIRPNRFGSWQSALDAAGLDYDEIRKHRAWDLDRVIETLKQRHQDGLSLRVSDVGEEDPALVAAARRHFGGWYEAIIVAGIDELEARMGLDGAWDEETARGLEEWRPPERQSV